MLTETFGHKWLEMDLPFPCELHLFEPRSPCDPRKKKVLVIFTEPKKGMVSNEWILKNYQFFNLIITYDRSLAHLPNVCILHFGAPWYHEIPRHKDFSVSFLLSTGGNAANYDGYPVRREVAIYFGWTTIPGRLFLSSRHLAMPKEQLETIVNRAKNNNYGVGMLAQESKADMFNSMFHIAIENNIDDYYFSEKITDCFMSYTVPIYWGTEKIFEFFDRDGIIQAKNAGEIHDIVASLTPQDYWKRLSAMSHNRQAMEQFIDLNGNLRRLILENLG